ncbi:MAG TPA: twin-arginine translocase TatA/TatE family subunit [Nitratifractor sp.]|jgi:sec-independent protein translocase protein TatA|nr:twin-arginine translocase TatA/TatE family subunit [Nitratifractor sp.]HHD74737.1 twin-arginine translocase TatA/TatE family subunit [Nitratifractor sp.]HHH20505.1 twin-arginine translocase TatA/TatE family subunit [Nitratifractor sp.]
MGMPGGWELFAIIMVVVLLFGGKKIPELAKGLGKGIKDFKKAVNEDEKEGDVAEKAKTELEDKSAQATNTEAKESKNA